jgi:hypothetical protein
MKASEIGEWVVAELARSGLAMVAGLVRSIVAILTRAAHAGDTTLFTKLVIALSVQV